MSAAGHGASVAFAVVTPRVRIVGTGLIGTSLGIALSRAGYAVVLADPSPTAAGAGARPRGRGGRLPGRRGTGRRRRRRSARRGRRQVVADELDAVARRRSSPTSPRSRSPCSTRCGPPGGDLTRYVGSHPMAGRERSGAVAARGDLFDGRAWVVVPDDASSPAAVAAVRALALAAGGTVHA